MAIMEKEVVVKYNSKTYDHYEALGYMFPKYKDSSGNLRIKRGSTVIVKVEHLTNGSNVLLTKICDICDKNIHNQKYANILLCRKNNSEGIDKCLECQTIEKGKNRGIATDSNCVATTHPELATLFWDKEDTLKYTYSSGKKTNFKCPDCGSKIKNKTISNIYKQGLSCSQCSDGISYPEKFIMSILKQLEVSFEFQKTFDWSDNKKYDFYITSLNTIIETHGEQHYRYTGRGRSLKDEQENDRLKEKLAKENGIENYVVINCSESKLEYIKDNVVNSKWANIFNLTKIDFLKCHEYACNSLVKQVCKLWNSGIESTSKVGETLKLDRHTVRKYLKQGNKLGWCDYNAEKYIRIPKKVVQLSTQGNFIKEHNSQTEAAEECNTSPNRISSACNGRYTQSGGYIWIFKEDYDKITNQKLQEIINMANKTKEKMVYQLDENLKILNVYNSIKEAEIKTNTHHVSKVCNGKQKSAGGFKWMFKKDYDRRIES